MLSSVSLIFLSLGMGGLLQETGIIAQLMNALSQLIRTTGRFIFSTALIAIGVNFLMS
jgi:NhaC family Na+:H+ antiporter